MHLLKRLSLSSLFLLSLLSFSFSVSAKSPETYGQHFGLFINAQNQNSEVPTYLGHTVLQSYFLGMPLKASGDGQNTAPMTQKEFLVLFEKLRLNQEKLTNSLSDEQLYHQTWLKARRNNWLPEARLTYANLQEFLYRYEVSKAHAGMAYDEGLVLSISEINADRFPSTVGVNKIQQNLTLKLAELRRKVSPTQAEKNLIVRLENYQLAFEGVKQEIKRREHPLNKLPHLPEDIRKKVIDNDLNQVLDQLTYYYGKDAYYRKHNLLKGAMTINGRVFQPGENISFTQTLKEAPGGLGGYMMGYAIFGNEERLAYGGGLCGAATLFFTPSWRAGLEVVTRRGHSSYFSNLYPKESLGLDATIFFGSTDVIMKNNTDSALLYYVYDNKEKKEVTLYLIGNSPYTEVTVEGPIKTGYHAYRFIRRMTKPDNTKIEEQINTRYSRMY